MLLASILVKTGVVCFCLVRNCETDLDEGKNNTEGDKKEDEEDEEEEEEDEEDDDDDDDEGAEVLAPGAAKSLELRENAAAAALESN